MVKTGSAAGFIRTTTFSGIDSTINVNGRIYGTAEEFSDVYNSLYLTKITNLEMRDLLVKVMEIVKDSEENIRFTLDRLFAEKAKYTSHPPGTIRVFSRDHICFYNGKNWRKIHLRPHIDV